MPLPNLSQPNNKLGEMLRKWLPRTADIVNESTGQAMVSTPGGLMLGAGSAILDQFGWGRQLKSEASQAMDAMQGVHMPHVPMPPVEAGHTLAAVPFALLGELWKNDNYAALEKSFQKPAQYASNLSKLDQSALAETGMNRVVELLDHPTIHPPKTVTDWPTLRDWLHSEGLKAMGVEQRQAAQGVSMDIVDETGRQNIQVAAPEVSATPIMSGEFTQATNRDRAAEAADSIFSNILDPRKQFILNNAGSIAPPETIKELSKGQLLKPMTRQQIHYWIKDQAKARDIVKPLVEEAESPPVFTAMESKDLLDRVNQRMQLLPQRELVRMKDRAKGSGRGATGPDINIDATINKLRERGSKPESLLMLRRLLGGTPPNRLAPNNSPSRQARLVDLNEVIDQMFDILKEKE